MPRGPITESANAPLVLSALFADLKECGTLSITASVRAFCIHSCAFSKCFMALDNAKVGPLGSEKRDNSIATGSHRVHLLGSDSATGARLSQGWSWDNGGLHAGADIFVRLAALAFAQLDAMSSTGCIRRHMGMASYAVHPA